MLGVGQLLFVLGVCRWNLTDQSCLPVRYRNGDYYHNTCNISTINTAFTLGTLIAYLLFIIIKQRENK